MSCFLEHIKCVLLLLLPILSLLPYSGLVAQEANTKLKIDFPQKTILADPKAIVVNDIEIKNFSNDTIKFIPQIILPKHWTLIYRPPDSLFSLPPKSILPFHFKVFVPKTISYIKEYSIYIKLKDINSEKTLSKRLLPVKVVRHPHAPKQAIKSLKKGTKSTKVKPKAMEDIVSLPPDKRLWDDDGSAIPISFRIDTVEAKRLSSRFKEKRSNANPNSIFYNTLNITNLSDKAISIDVVFSKPRGWTLIPQSSLTKVIRGGEKYALSFRTFIPNKRISGKDYVIIAKIFSSKQLLLKAVYNYVTVTPKSYYRLYPVGYQNQE